MKTIIVLFLLVVLTSGVRINPRLRGYNFTSRREPRSRAPRTRILLPRAEALENFFNVYDPSFLAVVWPKISNGVHLFVGKKCWEDASVLYKELAAGRAWAYSVVDASGRYQSGLFSGNRFWLGSKDQCYALNSNYVPRDGNDTDQFHNEEYLNNVLRKEKHFDGGAEEWRSLLQKDELMRRLVAADNAPPRPLAYSTVQIMLNFTKITMAESYDVTLGVCLPQSCDADDVGAIVNFSVMINDNFKSNKTLPRTVKVSNFRRVYESYDFTTDIGVIALLCVTLLLLTIAIVATIIDLKLVKCPRSSKSMSFDLQKANNCTFDNNFDDKNHAYDVLTKKESNVVDMETLTINNIDNTNNINLVTVKKVMKPNAMPPSITLDVVSMEKVTGSCKRCGKYKKQCNGNSMRHFGTLPACPRVKSFVSLTESKPKENCCKTLFLCFSLSHSWKRIFNTNMANKDLSIVHGMRIFSTLWIILVHVIMIVDYVSENGGEVSKFNSAYYVVATGTLAFDTLFFVSGLFSAHHFFYMKSQYTVEELVSFGGTCGQVLQVICFVTNRAVRILPSYAYAIFLSAVLARGSQHTAALTLPEMDDINCDAYWWRNLLYISTVFPRSEQCMQISWVMSVETQLHVCSALLCAGAALTTGRRVVFTAGAVAALLAAAADISGAYYEFASYISNVFVAYGMFIQRPLARVVPYFVGTFAGWLIHKLDGALYINKKKAAVLWLVSVSVLSGTFAMPWMVRHWLLEWMHITWPLALLWPTVVFSTNLAGASRRIFGGGFMSALSRVSVGALLLHGVARPALLAAGAALCRHPVCIWSYFMGTSAVTLVAALVLSLLVETPCCSLLRRLSDYAT